jgi:phosphatidylserine/phosphatidylglycerophosphate/cardiolipin synthase-like enzyme
MSIRIAAYANGDDVFIAWKTGAAIPGCLGFALHRRRNGKEEIVENRIGWEDLVPPPKPGSHKPSNVWPIQRFQWTDFMADPGDTVQYRVVPMIGTPDALTAAETLGSDWTPPLLVSAGSSSGIQAFFNRGIVMSQAVARRLKAAGGSPAKSLKAAIGDPKNETRKYLEGQLGSTLVDTLTSTAAKGYEIYAMLFELDDPELIAAIKKFKKRAHVILSNGAHAKASDDENADARGQLQGSVDLQKDVRMVGSGHLAHNKFCVFVDPKKGPEMVWTGSQNWTRTGLCTQANNCLLIHDVKIATAYRDQWKQLVAAKNDFPKELLDANDKPKRFDVDGGKATLYFTPTRNFADLGFARPFIDNAESGILFLMFNPGPRAQSLLQAILDRVNDAAKPQLHVVGVINQDPSTKKTPVVNLFTGPKEQSGDQDIIQPEGLDKDVAKEWLNEITRSEFLGGPGHPGIGHAMVHSKVIVVDPFGPHPVVMTGSHNLGPTASSANDENLLIIENDPALAEAYVVNIGAVHDAFRFRFARKTSAAAKKYHGLHTKPSWQDPYFKFDNLRRAIDFWVGPEPVPAAPALRRRRVTATKARTGSPRNP